MKREDHLLTVLAEECAKVVQQASKALRFGMVDYDPRDPERTPNRRRIEKELAEAIAVAELLGLEIHTEDKKAKREKLKTYMDISRKLGRLE